jgi:hypothetical protein
MAASDMPMQSADDVSELERGSNPNVEPDLNHECPHAAEEIKGAAARRRMRQPDITRVTRPALQKELVMMAESDQAARQRWDPSTPWPPDLAAVDLHNLTRLKQILHQDGFPSAKMVGYNGVVAAFVVLQHASDPTLQRRWLPQITAAARSGVLSPDDLALFTDRLLVASGKPQRYGSQFTMENGELVAQPTEDPANLDRRRKSLGMIPEVDYLCVLRFYTTCRTCVSRP